MFMDIKQILKNGGVGVIPTDTVYGLVGSAFDPEVVDRIYKLRKRSPTKPYIILISKMDDLGLFGIKLDKFTKDFLEKNWPNPLSVVQSVTHPKWDYLHRGTKTLAFRVPKNTKLIELLKKAK